MNELPQINGKILPCFPCTLNKRPLIKDWPNRATTNTEEFLAMAPKSNFLFGVLTGKASGFDVLDIDPDGTDWLSQNKQIIPTTRLHLTRRNGVHFLFNHSPELRSSAGKICSGVDVRADGGFIIWWPFVINQTKNETIIADWPQPILDVLNNSVPKNPNMATPGDSSYFIPSDKYITYDHCMEILNDDTNDGGMSNEIMQSWLIQGQRRSVSRFSREDKFSARAAVQAIFEISNTPTGKRNKVLNAKSFALGRLLSRGWILPIHVARALWYGALNCKLVQDEGYQAVVDTINSGVFAGLKNPYPNLELRESELKTIITDGFGSRTNSRGGHEGKK